MYLCRFAAKKLLNRLTALFTFRRYDQKCEVDTYQSLQVLAASAEGHLLAKKENPDDRRPSHRQIRTF